MIKAKNDIFKNISACPTMVADNINSDKSELRQWPVQLKLINTAAPFLESADLLIAADCTAYAYANFHRDFIKGHVTAIGCPKLDDGQFYKEEIIEILKNNNIKSIKVVKMSVPCCTGIAIIVRKAIEETGKDISCSEVRLKLKV